MDIRDVDEYVGVSTDGVTAEQAVTPISNVGILLKHTNVIALQVDSLIVPILVWYTRIMTNVSVPVQMVSLPCIADTKMSHKDATRRCHIN